MTDRELLELAAKAADIKGLNFDRVRRDWPWNPLDDDGDALRLAVKLFLHVSVDDGFTEAQGDYRPLTEAHDGDPYAATRRAIVRAAAEIGRGME